MSKSTTCIVTSSGPQVNATERANDIPRTIADSTKNGRLVSLDVFRGVTVAAMILVTNPGSYSAVYWPLLHADWNGWTPTDMIFPSFLLAVGIALTLSIEPRLERGDSRGKLTLHVIRRSAIIFAIGLALNLFPQFDFQSLRIPGVLQRIALCYLCGGLLYLWLTGGQHRSDEQQDGVRIRVYVIAGTTIAILILYWLLLKLVPVPGFGAGRLDSLGNLGAYIDRSLFGIHHMWPWGLTQSYGVTYDPEGLLSTLPAIATLLIGILVGERMRGAESGHRKALGLVAAGCGLLVLGWLLDPILPINKRLWTSTFVLFSAGFSIITFSLCYWIVDLRRSRWWTPPALAFGTNAILAFVLANVFTPLADLIHVPAGNGVPPTVHEWGYGYVFSPWLSPHFASLAYAIAFVLIILAIISLLYRRRIFLRV